MFSADVWPAMLIYARWYCWHCCWCSQWWAGMLLDSFWAAQCQMCAYN